MRQHLAQSSRRFKRGETIARQVQRKQRLKKVQGFKDASLDFGEYEFRVSEYLNDHFGWQPWHGPRPGVKGQADVVLAYERALKQQIERQQFELGLITEDELTAYRPGMVIKNIISVDGGHNWGKTKIAGGLGSHFFDVYEDAIISCFSTKEKQTQQLLFTEIRNDRNNALKPVRGRVLKTPHVVDDLNPAHFITSKNTDDSLGGGREKTHGQHSPHQMFIVDEAEGIPQYVFDSIDSMASGGIAIVLILRNPRTTTCAAHKLRSRDDVEALTISTLDHPNIRAGKPLIPGAVERPWVEFMLKEHCVIVDEHDVDLNTFELSYRPGVVYQPLNEFKWRVLGIASDIETLNTLIPTGRFDAAINRPVLESLADSDRAFIGVDCARYGDDKGTVYVNCRGQIWRHAQLSKKNSLVYFRSIREIIIDLYRQGVTYFTVRIDAGGGFGSGPADLLQVDPWPESKEFPQRPIQVEVIEVHNNANPQDRQAFHDLITELYYHAGEALKDLSLIPKPFEGEGDWLSTVPESLRADLTERAYTYKGYGVHEVKALVPKDTFKKKNNNRSPDDGDGFVYAAAPSFLFADEGQQVF